MSIRDRLQIAYENVAYNADKTWRSDYFNLQKSHMDLFLKESQLQLPTNLELRPRTVRDCIPNSKLARYSNYEYSYSRELSYNIDNVFQPSKSFKSHDKEEEKEPWMLEDVDQLFKFYCNNQRFGSDSNNQNKIRTLISYESPFLKTNSLKECLLKLQITKGQIRKIWDIRNKDCEYGSRSSSKDDQYLLYKAATRQFFLPDYENTRNELRNEISEWHKNDQVSVNSLNLLRKNFGNETIKLQADANSIQQRRLYSAVLQGFAANKISTSPIENRMTILKRNYTKNGMEKLGSISEVNKTKREDFNNNRQSEDISLHKKVLSSDGRTTSNNLVQKTLSTICKNNVGGVYNTSFTMNHYHSQIDGLSPQTRLFPNNFVSTATITSNTSLPPRFRQAYSPSNCQYPFYMLFQNSLQQQNLLQPLYNPIILHRTGPTTIERSIQQRTVTVPINNQVVTPQLGNIPQNNSRKSNCQVTNPPGFKPKVKAKLENLQQKKELKSSGLFSLVNVRKISEISSCSSFYSTSKHDTTTEEPLEELEKLALRTVDMVLGDSTNETVLVKESKSDRLERQALEQYQSSYDNMFLELERQAAEEYEDSENCKVPPNLKILFGGFFIQCHFFFVSLWISILNI